MTPEVSDREKRLGNKVDKRGDKKENTNDNGNIV